MFTLLEGGRWWGRKETVQSDRVFHASNAEGMQVVI
jgi:hypothetical protein